MKSNLQKRVRFQSGFGLMEVMIAVGIMSIVALGTMTLIGNFSKSQNRVAESIEADNFINFLRFSLSAEKTCSNSFSGTAAAALNGLATASTLPNFKFSIKSDTAAVLYKLEVGTADLSQLPASLKSFRVKVLDFEKTYGNEATQAAFAGPAAENATRIRGLLNIQFVKVNNNQDGVHSKKYQIPMSFFVRNSDMTIQKCTSDQTTTEEACHTLGGMWDSAATNLPIELRCIPQRSCIELGSFAGAPVADGGFLNPYTGSFNCPYDGTTNNPSGVGNKDNVYTGSGKVKWYRMGAISVAKTTGSGKDLMVYNTIYPTISCRICPPDLIAQSLPSEPRAEVLSASTDTGAATANEQPVNYGGDGGT